MKSHAGKNGHMLSRMSRTVATGKEHRSMPRVSLVGSAMHALQPHLCCEPLTSMKHCTLTPECYKETRTKVARYQDGTTVRN